MAAIFAQHHCDTREAGQLYAAWRKGSPAIRKRILDDPELFFKAQRQAQEKAPAGTGAERIRAGGHAPPDAARRCPAIEHDSFAGLFPTGDRGSDWLARQP
jgi:hypothetical protein